MECRKPWSEKWFAATPPIETFRLLIAIAAVGDPLAATRSNRPLRERLRRMLILDVSRVHRYPKATCDVYVKLPAEEPRGGDPTVCRKLKRTMCSTLDAAQRYAGHYA